MWEPSLYPFKMRSHPTM
uniref:Uncharacterized protein n=1 Tax=Rhizophora mucronata TaxID=61149 RepID=A0A2P2QLM1_RHIMU